jgi:hypothetical protein
MRPLAIPPLLAGVAMAVVVSGCGSTKTVTETTTVTKTTTVSAAEPKGLAGPGVTVEFGHIKSLTRKRGRWVMRFDPALFLSGVTANTAAAEDGAVAPGEPVPNDNYVVDESHRLYTYLVADDARITVLTRGGDQLVFTPLTVVGLAKVVDGTSDLELFEPLDTGVWITIHVDTVRAIHQQYRP